MTKAFQIYSTFWCFKSLKTNKFNTKYTRSYHNKHIVSVKSVNNNFPDAHICQSNTLPLGSNKTNSVSIICLN